MTKSRSIKHRRPEPANGLRGRTRREFDRLVDLLDGRDVDRDAVVELARLRARVATFQAKLDREGAAIVSRGATKANPIIAALDMLQLELRRRERALNIGVAPESSTARGMSVTDARRDAALWLDHGNSLPDGELICPGPADFAEWHTQHTARERPTTYSRRWVERLTTAEAFHMASLWRRHVAGERLGAPMKALRKPTEAVK
jgi:hypothetical protein